MTSTTPVPSLILSCKQNLAELQEDESVSEEEYALRP